MPPKQNPEIPEGQWTVNNVEKAQIRDLGRKLHVWLLGEAGTGPFHTKVVAGAFQYIMDLQRQKAQIIGDDFAFSQKAIEAYGLGDQLHEPFEDFVDPTPETPAQKKERLLKEAAAIDVEQASVTPTPQSNPDPSAQPPTGSTGPGIVSPMQKEDLGPDNGSGTPAA